MLLCSGGGDFPRIIVIDLFFNIDLIFFVKYSMECSLIETASNSFFPKNVIITKKNALFRNVLHIDIIKNKPQGLSFEKNPRIGQKNKKVMTNKALFVLRSRFLHQFFKTILHNFMFEPHFIKIGQIKKSYRGKMRVQNQSVVQATPSHRPRVFFLSNRIEFFSTDFLIRCMKC